MCWSRSKKSRRRGSNTEDTTPPAEPAPRDIPERAIQPARGRWASIFAATAFACSLVITVLLLALTGLFEDEENRRTILVWVALPVMLTFASWLSVQSGHAALRAVVWLSVVFIAFFIWIAVFSIGPYYLPVVILLMLAGFAPWPGSKPEPPPESTDLPGRSEVETLGTTIVTGIAEGLRDK